MMCVCVGGPAQSGPSLPGMAVVLRRRVVGMACPALSWVHPHFFHLPAAGPTPHSQPLLSCSRLPGGGPVARLPLCSPPFWSLSFSLGPRQSCRGSPL